jgi:predicted secreted protein
MASAELSMETLYVYGDAGQAAIEAAFADNDDPAAVVLTSADDTAGVFEYAGNLWITELELQMEMNEVVKYSISGTFTGAVVRTAIT